jgi:sugar phosphate isomerase/epimerase
MGFEGVELLGRGLAERKEEIKAALAETGLVACTICTGYDDNILSPDRRLRDAACAQVRDLLKLAGELKVGGLIFVPIFGPPRLPDMAPFKSAVELEKDLLVRILQDLAKVAEANGTSILLEPLNRYEAHLLNRLEQGVEIAQRVNSPSVKIMADFFHMNIEEADIAKSLVAAGAWVQHVHLADNTRKQPGTGNTDFKSGFAALKKIGYDKYMALECGFLGDPEKAIKESVKYLKACME